MWVINPKVEVSALRWCHQATPDDEFVVFNKWFAGWETQFSIGQLKSLMEQSGFGVKHQYGRWMRPSLFYRIIREVLKKLNIRLAMYPVGFKYTRKLRDWLRNKLISRWWAFYTFLDIGVIGTKKELK